MSDFLWQTFITLLVIIDPFTIVPVFIGLTRNDSSKTQEIIARKSCTIGVILLIVFAIAGDKLLNVMGISHAAFRIAGGFLLFLAGIEMVMAKSTDARTRGDDEPDGSALSDDISVFPLAIPLIAGPGSMTSIVVLMRDAEQMSLLAEISVVLIAIFVLILTYTTMRLGEKLMKILGFTGLNVLTRVFGVILTALATQYILHGLTEVIRGK